MAFQDTYAVMEMLDLPTQQRFVLLALAHSRNNVTGRCDPSLDRIAQLCPYGRSYVQRALKALEILKLIQVNHGGHKKRNGYQLHLENYQAALQTMSETIGYLVTSNEGTVIGYYSWGLGLLSNPEKVTAYRVGVTGLSFIGYLVTSNLGWNKNLERNLVAPSAKDPLYNSNVYEDEAGIAAKAKTTPPIASDPLADLNVYQDQIDEDFL